MSSILEALRELESRRTPATGGVAAPLEQPAPSNRTVQVVGVVSMGLIIGALGVLLLIALSDLLPKTAAREAPATPAPPAEPERRTSARPSWLDTAEPPRAQLGRQAAAKSEEPRVAAERPHDASRSDRLAVDSVEYSPDVGQRAVMLRFAGESAIRLREGESARGIEVQSIQPNGVYVRRGGEIFMLSPGP